MFSIIETNDFELWIEKCLAQHGMNVAEVSNISRDDFAVVDKIETEQTLVYFKAGNSLEARITAELADNFPDLVPRVLGCDFSKDWLLTESGGQRLSEEADLSLWLVAARKLGEFHRQSTKEQILSIGCPEFPFEALLQEFRSFLGQRGWLDYWDIDRKLKLALQFALPRLEVAHQNILSLGIPETCCHGDSQPMNALSGKCGITWFDWREAAIAHPLTDIGWMLSWLLPKRPELVIRPTRSILAQLYRAYCVGYGMEHSSGLEANIDDAILVAMLHRVIAYHEKYYSWSGTKPYYVTYYLKRIVKITNRACIQPQTSANSRTDG